jgi:hypothetical protein
MCAQARRHDAVSAAATHQGLEVDRLTALVVHMGVRLVDHLADQFLQDVLDRDLWASGACMSSRLACADAGQR